VNMVFNERRFGDQAAAGPPWWVPYGAHRRVLFERTLRSSWGLRVIEFLTKLPGLRELTTVPVAAVLTVN
jgi:hypothetical protein